MKTFVYLQVLLLLFVVGINGRHVDQNDNEGLPESEEETELLTRLRDHATPGRHHRRSRQMHAGYDYTPPYYYNDRRDYGSRQQEELLSRILKSLDDIIGYIRRPAPAPQPVYIPYPVIQYVPSNFCGRPGPSKVPEGLEVTTQTPNLTIKFPVIEDENQLWASPAEEIPEDIDGINDGTRPINLSPIKPTRPTSRPPPAVEHGSVQAGAEQTTSAPVNRPGACETAILSCCTLQGKNVQKNCFARYNCMKTYATNRACEPSVIKRVLDHFSIAYAPVRD